MPFASWGNFEKRYVLQNKPLPRVDNASIEGDDSSSGQASESFANVTLVRTTKIGLVLRTDLDNKPYAYYLYRGRVDTGDLPGFYYDKDSRQNFRYYGNGATFGTKNEIDFLREIGAAPKPPATSSTVSSATANAYAASFQPRSGRSIDTTEAAADTATMTAIINRQYRGSADFAERVSAQLSAKGYTAKEIQAYLKARDDKERGFVKRVAEQRIQAALKKAFGSPSRGGSGGSSAGSSGGSSNGSNQGANFGAITRPQVATQLVVRMPNGYSIPQRAELASITRPALHQAFVDPVDGKHKSYTYIFDYIPSNIQYSGLGSEWVEIPRAENYPFVDWSRYQLMRVSMSWLVATDRTEDGGAVVHDGLFTSVDSTITSLRRMAQRKQPVTIVNMDDLLSVELIVDVDGSQNVRSVRGMQFVISDLSVTAVRRTTDPRSGEATSPSKLAVAQVQMTLQEIPIESVKIVTLPTLSIAYAPPKTNKRAADPMAPSYSLASEVAQPPPNRNYLPPPGEG